VSDHRSGRRSTNMTLITVAWIAFGLGTTLGFFLARSVENEDESLEHAKHDIAGS
jgi:hypothetical protein